MLTVDLPTVPARTDDQDEAIVVLVLRRTDPANPTGSPAPDSPAAISGGDPAATLALLDAVGPLGYDETQSYVTVASLTDVEQGGAVTIAGLREQLASS